MATKFDTRHQSLLNVSLKASQAWSRAFFRKNYFKKARAAHKAKFGCALFGCFACRRVHTIVGTVTFYGWFCRVVSHSQKAGHPLFSATDFLIVCCRRRDKPMCAMGIPNYKDIVELLKKGLTIEAQEKIMELREAAMELQEQNLQLREKVAVLEAKIKRVNELKLDKGMYWVTGDPVPLCQHCYDKDGKLVHLQDTRGNWNQKWQCLVCENLFGDMC